MHKYKTLEKKLLEQNYNDLHIRLDNLESHLKLLLSRTEKLQDNEEFLTRSQVSEKLQVTRQTLSEWNKKGVLKAIRIGTRIRYRLSDILKLQPQD